MPLTPEELSELREMLPTLGWREYDVKLVAEFLPRLLAAAEAEAATREREQQLYAKFDAMHTRAMKAEARIVELERYISLHHGNTFTAPEILKHEHQP